MAKNFAPRIAKTERKKIEISDSILSRDIFKVSDERLLKGARLTEVRLADITVKEQVRTKFNDSSLKELAENIKVNGLIQPLVLHQDKQGKLTLICGERRFRAMSSIHMEKCPCFVLDNKTEEELMAIQFSENSAREALHYIDKADGILNYQVATNASERKIQAALGISKSEVHRSLMIAKMDKQIKEAAKVHDIEKYVLLELDAIESQPLKQKLKKMVVEGHITKRLELKKAIKDGGLVQAGKKVAKKSVAPTTPKGMSANALLKALKSQATSKDIDAQTKKALKELIKDAQNIIM